MNGQMSVHLVLYELRLFFFLIQIFKLEWNEIGEYFSMRAILITKRAKRFAPLASNVMHIELIFVDVVHRI